MYRKILILFILSFAFVLFDVEASGVTYFSNLRLAINKTATSSSATKTTDITQKLNTIRSQKYDGTSSSFVPIQTRILTNSDGVVYQGEWVTHSSTGTKSLGSCFSDPACKIGNTMISIRTATSKSYEVAYWGDWYYN